MLLHQNLKNYIINDQNELNNILFSDNIHYSVSQNTIKKILFYDYNF